MSNSPKPSPKSMDREFFLQSLAERFPGIAANIGDIESGLLHCEMGVVSHATREAIEAKDWENVSLHFGFISDVLTSGDDAVRNAVHVSYLENVLLGENEPEYLHARALLPTNLRQAIIDLEAHFAMLAISARGT